MDSTNRELQREAFLKHYGVLGMRWGVRRRRVNVSKPAKNKAKGSSQNATKKRRMSNKELTSRVKRMKLEQEFQKLEAASRPATKSRIESIVKTAGTIATLSGSALTIYKNLNELSANMNKGQS